MCGLLAALSTSKTHYSPPKIENKDLSIYKLEVQKKDRQIKELEAQVGPARSAGRFHSDHGAPRRETLGTPGWREVPETPDQPDLEQRLRGRLHKEHHPS